MRLGFDVTPLCGPRSGVGTYVANLLAYLWEEGQAAHGVEDVVPLAHRPIATTLSGGLYGRGLNKTLWMHLVLPWHLARAGITVSHFTNNIAPLWTPSPYVVTVHDMTLWLFPHYHYPRRLVAMRPFIGPAVRGAGAVIAVSETTKRDVVRLLDVPADKVHVVYEAASPCFRPLDRDRLEPVRRRYRLPPRFVLYVGTLEPRKNLVRLVEAFARARKEAGLPHHLVLVGQRGWKDVPLFAAIERLNVRDVVHVVGYVPTPDVVALYNLAELFVFPSVYEGFGLPIVEAMACGTPVLTSNVGAMAEVAGDAAELANPHDVDALAVALRSLLTDEERRRHLGRRGLMRAADFSWRKAAEETVAVYRRAAAGGA